VWHNSYSEDEHLNCKKCGAQLVHVKGLKTLPKDDTDYDDRFLQRAKEATARRQELAEKGASWDEIYLSGPEFAWRWGGVE